VRTKEHHQLQHHVLRHTLARQLDYQAKLCKHPRLSTQACQHPSSFCVASAGTHPPLQAQVLRALVVAHARADSRLRGVVRCAPAIAHRPMSDLSPPRWQEEQAGGQADRIGDAPLLQGRDTCGNTQRSSVHASRQKLLRLEQRRSGKQHRARRALRRRHIDPIWQTAGLQASSVLLTMLVHAWPLCAAATERLTREQNDPGREGQQKHGPQAGRQRVGHGVAGARSRAGAPVAPPSERHGSCCVLTRTLREG